MSCKYALHPALLQNEYQNYASNELQILVNLISCCSQVSKNKCYTFNYCHKKDRTPLRPSRGSVPVPQKTITEAILKKHPNRNCSPSTRKALSFQCSKMKGHTAHLQQINSKAAYTRKGTSHREVDLRNKPKR